MPFEIAIVLHVLISMIESLALVLFQSGIYEAKFETRRVHTVAYGLYFVCNIAFSIIPILAGLRGIATLIFPLLFAIFLYNGVVTKRLFMAGIYVAYGFVTEPFAAVIISWLSGTVFPHAPLGDALYFIGAGVSTLTLLGIVLATRRKHTMRSIEMPYWQSAILFISVSICAFVAFMDMKLILDSGVVPTLGYVLAEAGIVVMSVMVFFVFELFQEHAQKESHSRILANQLAQSAERFEQYNEHQSEMRRLKHDYVNHMITLRQLAGEGHLAELTKYLEKYGTDADVLMSEVVTGIAGVDALIAAKRAKAASQDTAFAVNASGVDVINVSPVDFNIVLSNALDNALEACAELPIEVRHIELDMKSDDSFVYMRITNSSPPREMEAGEFITTKRDKPAHGFGIESMRHAVERYGGALLVESTDSKFTVRIKMRNQDK